jgi:ribosome recycling factor
MDADLQSLTDDLSRRMDGAMETLKREFSGLRTGRANPALLEPVRVEAYGQTMPLNQVATIAVPEPRLLSVQVWDRSMVNSVVAAIRDCGLGLNPQPDGQMIRVPLPILTEERRNDLAKTAGKYAEGARVAVRAVRRDGMEQIKAMEKKHSIGEDVGRDWSEQVQKLTDATIKRIDELLAEKEKDIRQV